MIWHIENLEKSARICILGTDAVLRVNRDGCPERMITLLRDLAKKCKTSWELAGRLFSELQSRELLVLKPMEYSYYYCVDIVNNRIEYVDKDKKKVEKLKI